MMEKKKEMMGGKKRRELIHPSTHPSAVFELKSESFFCFFVFFFPKIYLRPSVSFYVFLSINTCRVQDVYLHASYGLLSKVSLMNSAA